MKLLLWVWLLCAACVTCSSAQGCTEQSLVTNLGSRDQETNSGLVSQALDAGQGTESNVRILNQNIVCLATDTTRGQYRQASVVVEYTLNGVQGMSQIEFSCMSSGAWSTTVGQSSSRVQTPPNATLTTPTRRDCVFCLNSIDATHCSACPSNCDAGLRECTTTDCCNFIEDNMCVANCSGGRIPIPDNSTCDFPPPTTTPSTTSTPPTIPSTTSTTPTTPSTTPTIPITTTPSGCGKDCMIGVGVGVSLGVVIAIIIIIITVVICVRCTKRGTKGPEETEKTKPMKFSDLKPSGLQDDKPSTGYQELNNV